MSHRFRVGETAVPLPKLPKNQHPSSKTKLHCRSGVPDLLRHHHPNPPNENSLSTHPDKPLLLITWPGSDPSLPSILFNSHLDSVPAEPSKWLHHPFAAHHTADDRIYACGAQDDKCINMQYLETIRELKRSSLDHTPLRTVHISYVPEEEIGGFDGMMKFVETREFEELNIRFMLEEEGQASVSDGSRMFDGGAIENLMKSVEM